MWKSTLLYGCTFAVFVALAAAQFSTHPCHPNRNVAKMGCSCEHIRLPPEMCTKCSLRGYTAYGGNFDNCFSIYKIEEPECRAEIGKYVEMNECDTLRREQFKAFDDPDNFVALDYFVYAICEECCDCIPRESKEEEYEDRYSDRKLTNLRRGNCPAHAFYDICRVWPEVRSVSTKEGDERKGWPKMCPMVQSWFESEDSQGWLENEKTNMDWRLLRFLRQFNREASCRNEGMWKMCVGLERAQNRV